MRQTRPRANLPAPRCVLVRQVTGSPDYIARTVTTLREDGRLLAMTEPQQTSDGRAWVRVRILDRPAPVPATRRRRWPVVAAVTGAAAAAMATIGWLVAQLVRAVVVAAPTIAGGLALVLVLAWLLAGRAGVCCPGLHCPGCRH